MRTKKVAAKRQAKRRPAKKAYLKKDIDYIHDSNPIVSKLLKLKYRINDAYRGGNKPSGGDTDAKYDKDFVMGLIHNIRKRNDYPTKIQLIECNKIWKKYE